MITGLVIFWFLISLYAQDILTFLKIDPLLVTRTVKMVQLSNYFLPLQAFNQLLQTYISSQKITAPFTLSNLISILISIYLGLKYIIFEDYREIGFCYTRIAQEIFSLLYSLCILFIYSDPRALIGPSVALILKDFRNYMVYSVKTAFTFYGDCFSFELNTYLAASLGVINELAAYIAIINAVVYVFFISVGFANTFRIAIGNTLGKGDIYQARINSIIYTIYVFIVAIICIIPVEMYINQIAIIYSGKNEITSMVKNGIRAYYWNVFPTFILYAQGSIMRFLDFNEWAVRITVLVMPMMVLLISGLLTFYWQMGAVGLIFGFFGSKLVAVMVFFGVIYSVDWEDRYARFVQANLQKEEKELKKEICDVV